MGTIVGEIKNGDLYTIGHLTVDSAATKPFDVDTLGNITVIDIFEKPVGIPADAYWFPLDIDAMDETKTYNASEISSGVVFEDGEVRVPIGQSLEFNLNASLGLNWSGDWTIIYYKTPQSTHTGDLLGYDIDSLGCNSNSVGGGYLYWGKATGSNSIQSATPGTIDPAKYFNNRHAIVLTKSGTTITIRHRYIDGTEHVRTSSLPSAAANHYVTQYGYDLRLGGWDNGSASNAKYRDLIVVKRAITAEELKQLTQVFYDCSSGALTVQGSIKEVEVL